MDKMLRQADQELKHELLDALRMLYVAIQPDRYISAPVFLQVKDVSGIFHRLQACRRLRKPCVRREWQERF